MDNVESLVKTTLSEIEKLLNIKTVVGEPITIEGKIIVPLVSVGFGFGAAGGAGKGSNKQIEEGSLSGTFGGAGIRPTAVIICDERGLRIEQVRGGIGSSIEKIIQTVAPLVKPKNDKEQSSKQIQEGEK